MFLFSKPSFLYCNLTDNSPTANYEHFSTNSTVFVQKNHTMTQHTFEINNLPSTLQSTQILLQEKQKTLHIAYNNQSSKFIQTKP